MSSPFKTRRTPSCSLKNSIDRLECLREKEVELRNKRVAQLKILLNNGLVNKVEDDKEIAEVEKIYSARSSSINAHLNSCKMLQAKIKALTNELHMHTDSQAKAACLKRYKELNEKLARTTVELKSLYERFDLDNKRLIALRAVANNRKKEIETLQTQISNHTR